MLILNFCRSISVLITGSNLQGIHQRYQAVLDIMVGKQCLLTEAMRQFGIPRNTLRDYIAVCKLHIIDSERYKRKGWSKQNSKDWERSPRRVVLNEYRIQSNRLKEKKLLPFYLNECSFTQKWTCFAFNCFGLFSKYNVFLINNMK